jgi:predicted MFS family arabinose efflux permease
MKAAAPTLGATLWIAAALALGAAVSLGLARFSYALLLPPMRSDLGWSYFIAGAMNTANAAGYFVGALLTPRMLVRIPARTLLLGGSAATALLLAAHGLVLQDSALLALRLLTGVTSAAVFVSGGLLAARLGSGHASAGLVLGVYYGGTGVGIIVSALLVPPLTARAVAHAWQGAWWGLALAALLATGVTAWATRDAAEAPLLNPAGTLAFRWRHFGFGLAAYFMFGLGYIGYMTFVITLLREQGLSHPQIVGFYIVLGLGVIASSWLWARLLQRFRGGESLGLLNALLALATALPVFISHPVAVFVSGALFGSVFLSLVASTTALVRHNLPAAAWSGGIAAFTVVFAAGQIIGPSAVGWVADGPGGLRLGLACSAAVLALGALLAWGQKPLPIDAAPT